MTQGFIQTNATARPFAGSAVGTVGGSFVGRAVLYAILFGVAIAPTTVMLQFCRTPENLVVAAAMETRRNGNWLSPTLEGEPRTVKPPLATWLTAAAIGDATLAATSDASESVRARAARWLAWETRWPAIVVAALTLLATAELGRVLGGRGGRDGVKADGDSSGGEFGIAAMLLCGSGFLFLRFSSEAVTDTSLMLWVTVANVMLARALFQQQLWVGCIGAGLAMGLAMMSKGPVALLESVVPFVLFAVWQRRMIGAWRAWRSWIAPMLLGIACALLIALPWPLHLLLRHGSQQWHEWIDQLTGEVAPERRDPIWSYPVRLLEAVAPCLVLFIVGLGQSWKSKRRGLLLALCWLIVPIVILSCFKDRKDRYLLPMMPAAAVISAAALRTVEKAMVLRWLHWLSVIIIAIVFPLLAATKAFKGIDGRPWLSPAFAVTAAAIACIILVMGNRLRVPLVVTTFATMLLVQFVFITGYSRSEGGQSDMLPLARAIWRAAPDAEMLNGQTRDIRTSVDLAIYMNRITRWVPPAQWRSMKPTDRPRVVILLQEPGEPEPTADGWQQLASMPHGKERWWALMMPRA